MQMKEKLGSLLLGVCLVAAVFSAVPAEAQAAVGWTKSGNYWYYYNSSGVKLTGWQKLPSRDGQDWFYLYPNTSPTGQMAMGLVTLPSRNGTDLFYMDPVGESGAMRMGWRKVSGYWYYFNPVDEQGGALSGWLPLSGYRYYLNPSTKRMVTGWQYIGGYQYYFLPGDNGRMVTGWQTIGGVLYHFDANGRLI
jgi:glucan-binding YG repeat protein